MGLKQDQGGFYDRREYVPEDEAPISRVNGVADTWGDADLSFLGSGRRPAPSFPLTTLGPWMDWTEARARSSSAPPDYVAVSLLACVGVALSNVRWPLAGETWSEPPILWCAEVGSPSSGKSPPMDAAFTRSKRGGRG